MTLSCLLAAVAVAAPVAAQPAEPLGRLFFTPAQRASLDIARSRRARNELSSEKSEEAAPAAQSITYGGMVRRSDGKSTIWINGRPFNESEQTSGPVVGRIRQDGGILLQLPQSSRSVELKVGQTVELLSGTIEEGYSRGPVRPESKPKPTAKPTADAGTAKPNSMKTAQDLQDREQEQLKEALTRALEDVASGKLKPPLAAPTTAAPHSEVPR